ncbi:MAG: hypothetical protein LBN22_11175 [Clostridiales Family XIII bacterium]|jgi:uncharacterized FAD-dependent dehydrogenase|nr:hypothetical protein [Clostridiales Family XIII bacterium]
MLRIFEVRLSIGDKITNLPDKIAELLGMTRYDLGILNYKISRKSIDARRKHNIKIVYNVDFSLSDPDEEQDLLILSKQFKVKLEKIEDAGMVHPIDVLTSEFRGQSEQSDKDISKQPVIIGFGPAGMFAGLVLARAGLKPIIIERGKAVEERIQDVEAFMNHDKLNPESNMLFGEGGAGTFSDGKLTSGIGGSLAGYVIKTFSEFGGGEELTYLAKPHIGTDVLRDVVKRIREEIISLGGEIHFSTKLASISIKHHHDAHHDDVSESSIQSSEISSISCVTLDDDGEPSDSFDMDTHHLILAIGHSARDTVTMLYEHDVKIEQKKFSMGVRIEHEQSIINASQYGKDFENIYKKTIEKAGLPVAEYKLSCKAADGRGVYTFCMCPGGVIVPVASEQNRLSTNGMSYSARDGKYANAAILVDVSPEDFGSSHPLAGIDFQRHYEKIGYELGSIGYKPLKEDLKTFADGTKSLLQETLPKYVYQDILEGITSFGRKIHGFDAQHATVRGPETRSSSPVRIVRNHNLQAEGIFGFYPCGEGAGYAGGITSAAVDGIRCAEQILLSERISEKIEK